MDWLDGRIELDVISFAAPEITHVREKIVDLVNVGIHRAEIIDGNVNIGILRTGGVEVRWYPVPKGVLLHAKIGLFDGLLVLGSANWTLSGLGVNHELDVETTDAAVVQAYATRFESDWAKSA